MAITYLSMVRYDLRSSHFSEFKLKTCSANKVVGVKSDDSGTSMDVPVFWKAIRAWINLIWSVFSFFFLFVIRCISILPRFSAEVDFVVAGFKSHVIPGASGVFLDRKRLSDDVESKYVIT